jgi:hypothetical protein
MNRYTLAGIVAIVLAGGAIACDGDTPVTPKSQCQDGQTKTEHKSGQSTKYYECHNGEWIRVACFQGMTKTTSKGVHYACEGGEWKRKS